MEVVTTHVIPKIFTAYRYSLIEGWNETTGRRAHYVKQVKYHCGHCQTDFSVEHVYRSGICYDGASNFGMQVVYCPYCGTRHTDSTRANKIYEFKELGDYAPLRMEMSLLEYKHSYTLRIKNSLIGILQADGHDTRLDFTDTTEFFHFDVKGRRTVFAKHALTYSPRLKPGDSRIQTALA